MSQVLQWAARILMYLLLYFIQNYSMSTRVPMAPAARGPVRHWQDQSKIVPIMFIPAPWGVLAGHGGK